MSTVPSSKNAVLPLNFSGRNIEALLVPAGATHQIREPAIIVNLSSYPLRMDVESPPLRPWRSTTLRNVEVRSPGALAVLRVIDVVNLGRLTLDPGWHALGSTEPADSPFPRDTPLYVSTDHDLGEVKADRHHFTGVKPYAENLETFQLRLKLWYTPPSTDCFIHTGHKFLEVHAQIHGLGRMQKFREQAEGTLFENVLMPVGFTHESFAVVEGTSWRYPWHRYYADTDCVWLAVELHPCR